MNFRTATLLVIGMFGSFSVIVITMMVLFWPGPQRASSASRTSAIEESAATERRLIAQPSPPSSEPALTDPARTDGPEPAAQTETSPEPAVKQTAPPADPPIPKLQEVRPTPAGRTASRGLRVEQEEIKLLRTEMEKRLRQQLELHERKLSQLARQCQTLEPGQAAEVLDGLDDDTIREVLKRMDRDDAINVTAILVRRGRSTAIPIHHEGTH